MITITISENYCISNIWISNIEYITNIYIRNFQCIVLKFFY